MHPLIYVPLLDINDDFEKGKKSVSFNSFQRVNPIIKSPEEIDFPLLSRYFRFQPCFWKMVLCGTYEMQLAIILAFAATLRVGAAPGKSR